jgi:hypothetical protein
MLRDYKLLATPWNWYMEPLISLAEVILNDLVHLQIGVRETERGRFFEIISGILQIGQLKFGLKDGDSESELSRATIFD